MDPVSMIVILVTAIGSGTVGALLGRRRRAPAPIDPEHPMCSCEHALAYHDPGTRQCHGLMRGNPTHVDEFGPYAWERVPCTCRQYVGALPPDMLLASFGHTARALPPPPTAPARDKDAPPPTGDDD